MAAGADLPPGSAAGPTAPKADHLAEIWSGLQAIRAEHQPGVRGQAFDAKRRSNLASRVRELRADGYTRHDLFIAAHWVYTSANICAQGARATGKPTDALLRPSHCRDYVGLAIAERDGTAAKADPPKHNGHNGHNGHDAAPQESATMRAARLAIEADDRRRAEREARSRLVALAGGAS